MGQSKESLGTMEWDLVTRNKIEAYSRNTSRGNINKTFKYVYLNFCLVWPLRFWQGFPSSSSIKILPVVQETGDESLIPLLGISPGGGHGNPFQYSCWGNPIDRGAYWAMVFGAAKNQIWLKWPSMFMHTHTHTHTHRPALGFSIYDNRIMSG